MSLWPAELSQHLSPKKQMKPSPSEHCVVTEESRSTRFSIRRRLSSSFLAEMQPLMCAKPRTLRVADTRKNRPNT